MSSVLLQFVLSIFSTCGFAIIQRVPLSKMPFCIITGAVPWGFYHFLMYQGVSSIFACFLASCLVALISDIFSRTLKEASTIFIIPGIISLVPGAGTYYTMLSLLHHDMNGFADNGINTLMMAGAIAVGLLITTSGLGFVRSIKRKPAAS